MEGSRDVRTVEVRDEITYVGYTPYCVHLQVCDSFWDVVKWQERQDIYYATKQPGVLMHDSQLIVCNNSSWICMDCSQAARICQVRTTCSIC